MHRLGSLLLVAIVNLAITAEGFAQDPSVSELQEQIERLQLKLQLAEKTIEDLEKEGAELRRENAELKSEQGDQPVAAEDQFKAGVVWAGKSIDNEKKETRWAISIAKRNGSKFEGAVAAIGGNGSKIEFPVSGTAPESGDGLVVIESALMGRAKVFMRGTLRNGQIALAFSGTTPLGKKFFGSAALVPKN